MFAVAATHFMLERHEIDGGWHDGKPGYMGRHLGLHHGRLPGHDVEGRTLAIFDTETSTGIALRVEIEDQHTLADSRQCRTKIDGGGGFADAAFLIG